MCTFVVDLSCSGLVAAAGGPELVQLIGSSVMPLARLAVLVILGAVLMRFGVLTAPTVSALARLVVALLLPAFIATNILSQFRPEQMFYEGWYLLPISAVLMIGAMALLAYPIGLAGRNWLQPRYTVGTLAFHNAGYLTIPIITELYAGEHLVEYQGPMLALLFLFVMGISPLMWSVGVILFRGSAEGGDDGPLWKKAISPPFVASAVSVTACLLHIPQQVSEPVLGQILAPFASLGACTVPLMMLILGATLMQLDRSYRPPRGVSAAGLSLRLVLFPAIMFGLLSALMAWDVLDRSKAVILFIQSIMPTAVAIVVIAHRYGGERTAHAVSGLIFLQYVAAAITIPAWLVVWGYVYGYGVG